MSVLALITGSICKTPETRTGKNGSSYSFAMVRCLDSGGAAQFWRLLVFVDTERSVLDRLSKGDCLSAQGHMRAEIFSPDDGREPRVSLSLTASLVLPLKADAAMAFEAEC